MQFFDAMGQAQLDAAEGQIALSRELGRWLGRTVTRWLDSVLQHMPSGGAMPW